MQTYFLKRKLSKLRLKLTFPQNVKLKNKTFLQKFYKLHNKQNNFLKDLDYTHYARIYISDDIPIKILM